MTPPEPPHLRLSQLEDRFFATALPSRTLAGFVLATLAVIAIALVTLHAQRLRSASAGQVTHTREVTQRLEELQSVFQDAETGQRGFLLTGLERYLEPYDAARASYQDKVQGVRALILDNPTQLERLSTIVRLGTQKMDELKTTIELRRDGRPSDALDVMRTDRGRRAMDGIRAAVAEMKETESRLLAERTAAWQAAASSATTVIVVGSLVLLVLIGAAATMSARDFRAQQTLTWLGAARSGLSTAMQRLEDTEALGAKVASFLAQTLEASVGAVYFARTGGKLERVGGFAVPGKASEPAEGLTRQAYLDNRVTQTRDVPEDFFPVSSGLGKSRARHLVVAPLTADGIPVGVIELGLLRPLPPHGLELLERAAEPVGLALRATKDRRDLRDALEETQRQAEELQTQQEELRVQNEELEQQSQTLQESQGRLENQQTELEQINAHLEEQTQAIARQRDDLARAQADLQRASTYKSEFLANMSHELRTPLNSSLILAKLLSENHDGNLNAEQIKFAETIYSAGNDLLTLINDILDLSKIEAGKLDIRPEEVTLARLIEELGDVFRPIARDKGIELGVGVDAGAPATLVTDPTRLAQILKNLLSNALKFTERGGVTLRVRRDGRDGLAFDVKDTGIGIAPEQHEVIFEAFRQADGTTNRKYGGTGLGLSISRDLARLLGGELKLESAPGRGSTFTLTLPARIEGASELPSAPVAARPAVAPGPAPAAPQPAPRAPRPQDRAGRLILLIEDDPAFAGVLQRLARELEFEAVVAVSGEEGLRVAEELRPSAIVLDVGLPDRSGLSVLDALKHQPATRHIPVHVISASDYTRTALEMGAAGYAVKPVKREELVQALKNLEAKFTQALHRILVVEDDPVARESTCRLLEGRDVETVAVGSAAEALAKLSASTFDCMVLDLSLPDRSGFELLDEMSKMEGASFPPVIVYTGRSLSRGEEQRLRRLSHSIIIKGARSPERLLDEVTLFLHQVEAELPAERQRMLRDARNREAIFEGKRVLVVEDDVRNIFALSRVFEPRGAKVDIARNGREALEQLRGGTPPDLVLMDIMMPEMDGLEATRRIRAMPEQAGVPIIALTAKAMADDRDQCLAAGADDYIAKPLDVDKLLSLARVWVRR
jgi:CheY-like chemotaxis protein/CHASE3 domain sensor protein